MLYFIYSLYTFLKTSFLFHKGQNQQQPQQQQQQYYSQYGQGQTAQNTSQYQYNNQQQYAQQVCFHFQIDVYCITLRTHISINKP